MRNRFFHVAGAIVVGILLTPGFGCAQDVPEMGAAAVSAYAEGMEAYARGQNTRAMGHFLRAHELDESFYTALFLASLTAMNAGQSAVVDSVWAILEDEKHRLSPYYRYRYESQKAQRVGQREAAIAYARLAVEESPKSKAAYNLALQLNRIGRAEEAKEVLLTLGHDDEPMRSYLGYYTQLAGAHRWLGEYEEAIAVVRLQRERFPSSWSTVYRLTRLHGATGQTAELDALFAEVRDWEPTGAWTLGRLMADAGMELSSHGYESEGEDYLRRSAAWLEQQTELSGTMRNFRQIVLWSLGEWESALVVNEALVRDFPESPWYRATHGMISARTGDRDAAREALAWLERRGESQPINPAFEAYVHVGLGDEDAAVAAFERALEEGWAYNSYWPIDPVLAELREREDFQAFLAPQG